MIRRLLATAALLAVASLATPAAAADPPVTSLPFTAGGATYQEGTYSDGTHFFVDHMVGGWTGSAWKPWAMDANGYGGVNVFSSALPAGAATSAGVAQVAANTKPVTSFAPITVGTAFTPGLGIAAVCSAAGNVVLAGADASQITVPVGVGFNQFGFAAAKVVSQTATCTFTNLL